jgi:hypothetical protein
MLLILEAGGLPVRQVGIVTGALASAQVCSESKGIKLNVGFYHEMA